jgi:hypothetical protein
MTATKLADELELRRKLLIGKEHESGGRAILLYGHSADMLRQQAKEIKALKKENEKLKEIDRVNSLLFNQIF